MVRPSRPVTSCAAPRPLGHSGMRLAYRGNLLAHVVKNSGASLLVCHAGLMDRLHDIDLAQVRNIVVSGDYAGAVEIALVRHGSTSSSARSAWRNVRRARESRARVASGVSPTASPAAAVASPSTSTRKTSARSSGATASSVAAVCEG